LVHDIPAAVEGFIYNLPAAVGETTSNYSAVVEGLVFVTASVATPVYY
jgi:hypothetical protein